MELKKYLELDPFNPLFVRDIGSVMAYVNEMLQRQEITGSEHTKITKAFNARYRQLYPMNRTEVSMDWYHRATKQGFYYLNFSPEDLSAVLETRKTCKLLLDNELRIVDRNAVQNFMSDSAKKLVASGKEKKPDWKLFYYFREMALFLIAKGRYPFSISSAVTKTLLAFLDWEHKILTTPAYGTKNTLEFQDYLKILDTKYSLSRALVKTGVKGCMDLYGEYHAKITEEHKKGLMAQVDYFRWSAEVGGLSLQYINRIAFTARELIRRFRDASEKKIGPEVLCVATENVLDRTFRLAEDFARTFSDEVLIHQCCERLLLTDTSRMGAKLKSTFLTQLRGKIMMLKDQGVLSEDEALHYLRKGREL